MSLITLSIEAHEEIWPLKETFRISRGSRTETRVIVATISDGEHTGRGEGVPVRRYNQTSGSVLAQIEAINPDDNFNRTSLQSLLPPGAARNALDCALWDLDAKRSGKRVWEIAGIPVASEIETSFTISLDAAEKMGQAAKSHSAAPILKLKLRGDREDLARVTAVRKFAPTARLLIDANESWSPEHYRDLAPELKELGVEVIEQPFPADADEVLEKLDHPVPVCADESCHTTIDLPRLKNRYEMINVKLDKTGGFTEALFLCERACENGFKLLIGCMACTSLGIAPARLLASDADYADLDGAILLARDRDHGLQCAKGQLGLPPRELWG